MILAQPQRTHLERGARSCSVCRQARLYWDECSRWACQGYYYLTRSASTATPVSATDGLPGFSRSTGRRFCATRTRCLSTPGLRTLPINIQAHGRAHPCPNLGRARRARSPPAAPGLRGRLGAIAMASNCSGPEAGLHLRGFHVRQRAGMRGFPFSAPTNTTTRNPIRRECPAGFSAPRSGEV